MRSQSEGMTHLANILQKELHGGWEPLMEPWMEPWREPWTEPWKEPLNPAVEHGYCPAGTPVLDPSVEALGQDLRAASLEVGFLQVASKEDHLAPGALAPAHQGQSAERHPAEVPETPDGLAKADASGDREVVPTDGRAQSLAPLAQTQGMELRNEGQAGRARRVLRANQSHLGPNALADPVGHGMALEVHIPGRGGCRPGRGHLDSHIPWDRPVQGHSHMDPGRRRRRDQDHDMDHPRGDLGDQGLKTQAHLGLAGLAGHAGHARRTTWVGNLHLAGPLDALALAHLERAAHKVHPTVVQRPHTGQEGLRSTVAPVHWASLGSSRWKRKS